MGKSFFSVTEHVLGGPLAALGWEGPRRVSGVVDFRRRLRGRLQIIVVQPMTRMRGDPKHFKINLTDFTDQANNRGHSMEFSMLSGVLAPDFCWHYDTAEELEEWLNLLMPFLLDKGMKWFDLDDKPDLGHLIRKHRADLKLLWEALGITEMTTLEEAQRGLALWKTIRASRMRTMLQQWTDTGWQY